tara:strand:- start:459 stop:2747 length:2289 start_codon:yes stop_codon:yes gene_type:complete
MNQGKVNQVCYRVYKLGLLSLVIAFLGACDGNRKNDILLQANLETANSEQIAGVIISEASSSNTIFEDSDGDTPDWFEIYNSGNTSVDLNGWTATDDPSEITQWEFPNIILEPKEYRLVWASNKDQFMHSNFKLSSKGETISLYDSTGTLIDSLEVVGPLRDKSIGRSMDDFSVVYYESPTPGAINDTSEFIGILTNEILFSHDGGEFDGQNISLAGAVEGEIIRFTMDSSIPTISSASHSRPINIYNDTVIRARVFKKGFIPSTTFSRTYITSKTHSLPIVSLISANENFFDENTGIYVVGSEENVNPELPFNGANFGRGWEKDVHFTFYDETGNMGAALDAGIKVYGGWSRTFAQKSLSIFFRSRYGTDELEYPLFPNLEYQKFQSIVLRNTGNDWMRAQMRDTVSSLVMSDSGIELQAFRPVAVYLNGRYWGFHNIREKINEHFLDDKIDVQKSKINLLENNSEIILGNNEGYRSLINFVSENSLENDDNFSYVADRIDINNFITYQIAQIYLNNRDWPHNNIKFWNSPDTKWRWIFYDTDYGWDLLNNGSYMEDSMSYAVGENTLESWIAPPWSTVLLRKLLKNTKFRNDFLNKFADEFNQRFLSNRINSQVESVASKIEAEMGNHFDRWYEDYNSNHHNIGQPFPWRNRVEEIKTFAENRTDSLKAHIINYFQLSGSYGLQLDFSDISAGKVILNSLSISTNEWKGNYFNEIPILLTAVPNDGYSFSHWEGDIESSEKNIEVVSSDDLGVKAVFYKN